MSDRAPATSEGIHHVYDLLSIQPAIRYLHAATGFPKKQTWLKEICNGSYLTWPLIKVKNVNKFFPESEETQHGHMRGQRQGVRSTKYKKNDKPQIIQTILEDKKESEKLQGEDTRNTQPIKKESDIIIEVYSPKETIYTDQNGTFPHVSSQGNRYIMLLAHIDSDSI